jgi:hypothetical protein
VTIPIPSSDIRDWPKFRLADSPALLEHLGEGDIDFYDALTFEWIECPILYVHAVKTDSYLLLRRTGIECEDFDTKFALATRKGDSSSHSYISNVRQSVVTKPSIREKVEPWSWMTGNPREKSKSFQISVCRSLHHFRFYSHILFNLYSSEDQARARYWVSAIQAVEAFPSRHPHYS